MIAIRHAPTITLDAAERLLSVGKTKAAEIESPSNIAIVDSFGFLIAHVRMDRAQLPSIEHSINKACTSALFKKATSDLKSSAEPGGELFGLNVTLNQRVIVFGGGIPLFADDEIAGAVGVSGGTCAQDEAVASAVAKAFAGLVRPLSKQNSGQK